MNKLIYILLFLTSFVAAQEINCRNSQFIKVRNIKIEVSLGIDPTGLTYGLFSPEGKRDLLQVYASNTKSEIATHEIQFVDPHKKSTFNDFGCFMFVIDNSQNKKNISYRISYNDGTLIAEGINIMGKEHISFQLWTEENPPLEGINKYYTPTINTVYIKAEGVRHNILNANNELVAFSTTQWIDITRLDRGLYIVHTYTTDNKIIKSKFRKK